MNENEKWKKQAACRGMDPALFFAERGDNTAGRPPKQHPFREHKMKAVCRACPVRVECLEYGLNEREGVWGGMTEVERRQVRRQRRNGQQVV